MDIPKGPIELKQFESSPGRDVRPDEAVRAGIAAYLRRRKKGGISEELVYEQDTSSSTDGWTNNRFTLTFGVTVGGRDDVLQGSSIANPGQTSIISRSDLVIGNVYRIEGFIRLKSDNALINGVEFRDTATTLPGGALANQTLGVWIPFDITSEAFATNTLRIHGTVGGSVVGGGSGDVLYLEGIKIFRKF